MKKRELTPEEQKLWDDYTSNIDEPFPDNYVPVEFKLPPPVILPPPYNPKLDLHHMTLAVAHAAVNTHISRSYEIGKRSITIVTGKSGQIAVEFPNWITLNPLVTKRELQNGGGAWKLWLKKNTSLRNNS